MPSIGKEKSGGSPAAAIFRAFLKAVQGILGFVVLIMCITAIGRLRDENPPQAVPFRLVFATIASGISTMLCPIYSIRSLPSYQLFFLDWVSFIGWLTATSLLGRLLGTLQSPRWAGMDRRLITALFWLCLTNMVLWFATACMSTNVFLARLGWKNGEDEVGLDDWELPPYEPIPRAYRWYRRRRYR